MDGPGGSRVIPELGVRRNHHKTLQRGLDFKSVHENQTKRRDKRHNFANSATISCATPNERGSGSDGPKLGRAPVRIAAPAAGPPLRDRGRELRPSQGELSP